MKNLQKLDDFQKLSKDNLIEEMMKGTIKGGCCEPSMVGEVQVDWYDTETGETTPVLRRLDQD